jgi:hypothetical protein
MTDMINTRTIRDLKDTIITAVMVAFGTDSKTLVHSRFCSQKNLAFHSISGNPYSGYGASSGYNYNQQQQWSAADYYQYESKAFHLAYCMIRKFDF